MKKTAAFALVVLAVAGCASASASEPAPTIGHSYGPSTSSELVIGHVVGPSISDLVRDGLIP